MTFIIDPDLYKWIIWLDLRDQLEDRTGSIKEKLKEGAPEEIKRKFEDYLIIKEKRLNGDMNPL